jgi:hypothetical protein
MDWHGCRSRASVVRGRRLTAWTMARPVSVTFTYRWVRECVELCLKFPVRLHGVIPDFRHCYPAISSLAALSVAISPTLLNFYPCLPFTWRGTHCSATVLFGFSSKFSFRHWVLKHVWASVTVRRGSFLCCPDFGVFCVRLIKFWQSHATFFFGLPWAWSRPVFACVYS